MTAFDFMVIGVVGLSTVLAFMRGFVRVFVSLAAWVLGVVGAVRFSEVVGGVLPDFGETPATRYIAAFSLILARSLATCCLDSCGPWDWASSTGRLVRSSARPAVCSSR